MKRRKSIGKRNRSEQKVLYLISRNLLRLRILAGEPQSVLVGGKGNNRPIDSMRYAYRKLPTTAIIEPPAPSAAQSIGETDRSNVFMRDILMSGALVYSTHTKLQLGSIMGTYKAVQAGSQCVYYMPPDCHNRLPIKNARTITDWLPPRFTMAVGMRVESDTVYAHFRVFLRQKIYMCVICRCLLRPAMMILNLEHHSSYCHLQKVPG